ncbi:c-type cytochrome [Arenicella xantha]|uniref:Cytochrome c n=1 Tax=Arenicella xantha TaxID=644221 RepID=A0A395JKS5_9GAMM|nr:c-type cytochrome [Arenicella xantha]RBP51179.1 cytochrome c [Arenicella xantha]
MNVKRQWSTSLILLFLSVLLGACVAPAYNRYEVRFPVTDQSVANGEQAFVDLQCIRCHTVRDYPLPSYAGERPFTVELGGVILNAKTRADLATSIMNPDHRLSERYLDQLTSEQRREVRQSASQQSPMHAMTKGMTVTQLVDLIAFLDSRYNTVSGYYSQPGW